MHRVFSRAANLKHWLARAAASSEALRRCKALFDKIYVERSNDDCQEEQAKLADEDCSTEEHSQTLNDIKALANLPGASFHARLRFKGVVYTRASTHLGNSLVLFYPGGDIHSTVVPGSIQQIYTIGGRTFFAIHRYHKPASTIPDPFARWPEFPAQTWSVHSDADMFEEVHVPWVHSHFAQLSTSNENVVVLDLSRV